MHYRRLPLKPLYTCRDLGGYPTADGGMTRYGVFLRSEAPCELPEEDVEALVRYGVTGSADLRSADEQAARPSQLKGRVHYYPCPLIHRAAMFGDESHASADFDWGREYCEMLGYNGEFVRRALPLAAEEPGVFHYHCTTGKDRTGVLSCLLLALAGVSREDIAADYCVSQIYLEPVYARMRSGALKLSTQGTITTEDVPGGMDRFFHTPASAMLALMDHIQSAYGGAEAFVRACGVPQNVVDAIRRKFVAPAPERD